KSGSDRWRTSRLDIHSAAALNVQAATALAHFSGAKAPDSGGCAVASARAGVATLKAAFVALADHTVARGQFKPLLGCEGIGILLGGPSVLLHFKGLVGRHRLRHTKSSGSKGLLLPHAGTGHDQRK